MTKGVEQRIEEFADKPSGFKPNNAIGYIHLLPLSEIISTVLGTSSPNVKSVWTEYSNLIKKFGNEYTVLINTPLKELTEVSDPNIAEAIVRVREERAYVTPGYDGVYGQIDLTKEIKKEETHPTKISQHRLSEWCQS